MWAKEGKKLRFPGIEIKRMNEAVAPAGNERKEKETVNEEDQMPGGCSAAPAEQGRAKGMGGERRGPKVQISNRRGLLGELMAVRRESRQTVATEKWGSTSKTKIKECVCRNAKFAILRLTSPRYPVSRPG